MANRSTGIQAFENANIPRLGDAAFLESGGAENAIGRGLWIVAA